MSKSLPVPAKPKKNPHPNATIPPIIRPGNRKGFKKSTYKEIEEKLEILKQVMLKRRGASKYKLRRFCLDQWDVTYKQADIYIGRARDLIFKAIGRDKDQTKAEAVAYLETIMNDKDATIMEKIKANAEWCELLGLYAPKTLKTEISGPAGGPVQHEDVTHLEKLEDNRLRQLIDLVPTLTPANGNGKPNGGQTAISS